MIPDTLYHYTSLDVLNGLFAKYDKENPFLNFWATNCTFVNDPKEILVGLDIVKKAFKSHPPKFFNIHMQNFLESEKIYEYLQVVSTKTYLGTPYVISFSNVKDNINMWKMYGNNGKGLMLSFKTTDLSIQDIERCLYRNDSVLLNDDYLKGMSDTLDKVYTGCSLPVDKTGKDFSIYIMLILLSIFVPAIKHDIYRYEHEYRMIVKSKTPKFRVINNILIPYTEVAVPVSSLKSITLGPDCDDRNLQAIKMFLFSKGLDDLLECVTKSEIPFRN